MRISYSIKIVLSLFALLLLTIHFGNIFIYSKPFVSAKTKADFYAYGYVYPYFHQNWNLFVPVPDANYKLYCIYGNNTSDIFSEIVIKHQENRLKGYEALVVAFSNSFHYFGASTDQQGPFNGPINNDLNFTIIENAAKNYLEYTRKIKIQKLKVMLITQKSQTKQQKIYFN